MKKKRKKHVKAGEPQTVTRAVTHIRLQAANSGKLAALDQVASEFLALAQRYVTLFCSEEFPDKFRAPCFSTALSERWHRVAIQQAAGIAQSWRTNRATALQGYLDELAEYQEQQADGTLEEGQESSTFDYWLRISTLDKGKPLLVPIQLADYHKEQLTDPQTGKRRTINSSVTLNKREGVWWVTLSYDETVVAPSEPHASVIGIDVGIANFLTTSDGKRYGTFHGKLRERQKRDREKRRRKAKLRACLQKRCVPSDKLPSTTSRTGQKLMRHVKQEINRAVKRCFLEHEGAQFAYEQLSVATMRYKARAMNAYMRASNLGHIPNQIAWNATKRGVAATQVKSAYSSQECHVCHYVDRNNRPTQQTFCCRVCSHRTHADQNAAHNIASRLSDRELRACAKRDDIKALLLKRHEQWKQNHRLTVVEPPVQLGLWDSSKTSTDVG